MHEVLSRIRATVWGRDILPRQTPFHDRAFSQVGASALAIVMAFVSNITNV